MKVIVLGATGNVGTSVVHALCADPEVERAVGVARRPGGLDLDGLEWARADIRSADLAGLFSGADAVIHLAWLIQPSHDPEALASVNVAGTRRVLEAVETARVPRLVYASSVGAYAPGPKSERVDEGWPATGIATSTYALHKATVEHMLDEFQAAVPAVRVVRLRPALTFKRSAGAQLHRYFLGRLVPAGLVRPGRIPVVPDLPRLRFQVVHTDDVAQAYRRAVKADVAGAFNIAAEPALGPAELADVLGARRIPVPRRVARAAIWASWRTHAQPTSEGWLDMALAVPLMSTDRARAELGWAPRHDARSTLLEALAGVCGRESLPTPALAGLRRRRSAGTPAPAMSL
jgi:nucleoside-diphosphate-sugar epimerase